MEQTIARVKELLAQREAIDQELAALFQGQAPRKRTLSCSKCGQEGHTARSCKAQPAES